MIVLDKIPMALHPQVRPYRLTEPPLSRDENPAVTELRRQARDLALRGKYKKAALAYEKLLERTSGDAQSVLRLAELRRRIGDIAGARAAYQLSISMFIETGWDAKAVAIEHALERLDTLPARLRVYARLWQWMNVVRCLIITAASSTWHRLLRYVSTLHTEKLSRFTERLLVRWAFGKPRPAETDAEKKTPPRAGGHLATAQGAEHCAPAPVKCDSIIQLPQGRSRRVPDGKRGKRRKRSKRSQRSELPR